MNTMMAEQMGLTNQDTTIDEMPAQCGNNSAILMVGSVYRSQDSHNYSMLQRHCGACKSTNMLSRPYSEVRQAV